MALESDQVRQKAFRAARSHSSRVRVAKVVLPLVALTAFAVAGGYVWFSRLAPGVAVDLAETAIRDGKLIMSNPKLDGFTADDRPYSMRAARAIQDLAGGAIDLENIQAIIPMDGGIDAQVSAPQAKYDSERNRLEVRGAFSIETSSGIKAEMNSADIDLKAGSMSTPDPVRISMPGSALDADSMYISENGKRMLFERSVRLVVQPEALGRSDADAQSVDSPGN